jgi:diguanylate cyclase (GGDEF)-like protein
MTNDIKIGKALDDITNSLRSFIELSLKEDDNTWADWLSSVAKDIEVRCWEVKDCQKTDCPAYKSECGRCWLLAGSLCGSGDRLGPDGTTSCVECDIYKANAPEDPCAEIQEQIITLVHNLRSRQIELKEMATLDPLTGLKNRHFFDMYMSHEVERVRRNKESIAVLMIDVNDFKFINDAHGHLAGDQVLKECAEVLSEAIRGTDVLFRFGGDEFLIVMSCAGDQEANILVNRISEKLDEWNSRKTEYNIRISLSIGYAVLDADRSLLEVIEEADRMMYEKKHLHKKGGKEGEI